MRQRLATVLALGARRGFHGLRVLVLLALVVAVVAVVVRLSDRSRSRRGGGDPAPPRTVRPDPDPDPDGAPAPASGPSRAGIRPGMRPGIRAGSGGEQRVIRVQGLTKRYGDKLAVDGLSFEVRPGLVTGFLGPNGAGKSTTMRLVMGLDAPTAGSATVNGRPYHELVSPLREVGALLEAKAIHPGRSAEAHLWMLAQTNGIPRRRVDEVLELVGLTGVARQRAGEFSLGMGQRLGIAAALLGDPGVLLFDEPVNGLDTDGIRWVRQFLRQLADEGRAVFVSSHLMSELQRTADHVIVIGKGRLIADMPTDAFTARYAQRQVRVRSPHLDRLGDALRAAGATTTAEADGSLTVTGWDADDIGELAFREAIPLHELATQTASLEEAFIESTEGDLEYRGDRSRTAAATTSERTA